ncbi:hypothetical protein H4217_001703 [Coemansia sp. RSA 1939]|nr:hypothetical protein H4217_001703 [Coemansia sp. RSA 1939]
MAMPFVAPLNYVRAKENRPHRYAYDYGSVDPGMFAPAPERSRPKRAPKRSIAYTIPLPESSANGTANSDGHVLGVNALALHLSSTAPAAALEGASACGGLLFSGGRDGVVKAWDLNLPLKRARAPTDNDNSAHSNDHMASASAAGWAIDRHKSRAISPKTSLLASHAMHSDWVNDIVLVNGSRTVVSASSDLTVRAWAPLGSNSRPSTIGSHLDYVKALAYSEHRQMVISGGLDRKIKLWDIGEGRPSDSPIYALQELGDASTSLSVYALACNPQGTLVVSGSPEKFIRIWDTRAAKQLTTLSGHTDHIRSVLLSTDSELVLSGSSDTTVKLWSMRMRRCLSTYSHHSNSVWSLHSTHPRFQTFYSASRDGLVAKTIGAGMHSEEGPPTRPTSLAPAPWSTATTTAIAAAAKTTMPLMARHEASPSAIEDALSGTGVVCVAVAKESHGVVKLVAADDAYIWTATKGPALNRWADVSIRKLPVVRQRGASIDCQHHRESAAVQAQPIPGRSPSASSYIGGHNIDSAHASARSPGGIADTECSTSDSDEFGSVTRNSLIEPLQSFLFDDNSLALTNGHRAAMPDLHHYCQGESATKSTAGLHRRNHTIDHPACTRCSPSQTAPYNISLRNTASPVLKAIQAEKARRSVIRESDNEDLFEDARMSSTNSGSDMVSIDSARSSTYHNLRHVRSRSADHNNDNATGSISAVLGKEGAKAQLHPGSGKTSGLVLECDTIERHSGADDDSASVTDSPLPLSSLIGANPTTSPSDPITAAGGAPFSLLHRSQHIRGHARGPSDVQKNLNEEQEIIPVRSKPDETIHGKHGLHRHKILPNKRQVLAQDTQGRVSLWDIMLCHHVYEFPATEEEAQTSTKFKGIFGKDFDKIDSILSANPESVNTWCRVDTRIGALTVRLDDSSVWSAEVHVDEIDEITPEVIKAMGDHERVNIGQWMLKRLFLNYTRARVKRGALSAHDAAQLNYWAVQAPTAEVVSVKGEYQPNQSPCSASGAQKVMAPGVTRSSSTYMSTTRLPALASASPNTPSAPALHPSSSDIGISEMQRQQQQQKQPRFPAIASQLVNSADEIGIGSLQVQPVPKIIEAPHSARSANGIPSSQGWPNRAHRYSTSNGRKDSGDSSNSSSGNNTETVGKSGHGASTGHENADAKLKIGAPAQPRHQHNVSIDTAPGTPQGAMVQQQQQQQTLGKGEDGESADSSGSTGKFMNRLLSMRIRKQKSGGSTHANASAGSNKAAQATTSSSSMDSNGSGNGLLYPPLPTTGRSNSIPDTRVNGLKAPNGNSAQGASSGAPTALKRPERGEFAEWAGPRFPTDTERTLALLQGTSAPWEQLYSPIVCPRLPLSRDVVVQICQDHPDASEPYSIYRNGIEFIAGSFEQQRNSMTVFRITDDPLLTFEMCMPAWLTDFLLFNRLPASYQEPAKVSFVLSPLQGSTLPAFPNPNARLVANGMLRARKLAIYVVDKIGLPLMQQPALNYVNAVDACLMAYEKRAVGNEGTAEGSGNPYIDLFTRAGEVVSEEERLALNDMVFWRSCTANKGGDGSSEYVGRPELYLDLFSKDMKLRPRQTLATIKANVWKASGDIQVSYEWAAFVKKRIAIAQGLVVKR